jgi:hypothetical protein
MRPLQEGHYWPVWVCTEGGWPATLAFCPRCFAVFGVMELADPVPDDRPREYECPRCNHRSTYAPQG